MERRGFLRTLSGAGLLSMFDPAYLSARERLHSGKNPADPVPKRRYGRAEDMISVIGFGGIVVTDVTPEEASNYVSEAVDRGINYFDVAQSGALTPLNQDEQEMARAIAMESEPIFTKHV